MTVCQIELAIDWNVHNTWLYKHSYADLELIPISIIQI